MPFSPATLSALSRLTMEESDKRKAAISSEAESGAGRALGQDYSGQRYREPRALDPSEQDIRRQTMQISTPNGDSTDELRNYALLQRERRLGSQVPRDQQMGDARFARLNDANETAARSGGPETPASLDETLASYPPEAQANVRAAMDEAPQRGPDTRTPNLSMGGMPSPPPVPRDPALLARAAGQTPGGEKARRLAELDRAGQRVIEEMGAAGRESPGTKRALLGQLENRRQEILARLAAPPADVPLPPPPPSMVMQPPTQGYPTVASALPIAPIQAQGMPQAPQRPVAQFPLIAPPVYAPSPQYPVPQMPNTAALDDAAAADYARMRLGR